MDGARILAAVCDGDLGPIKALILNRDANEYGRGAGVSALALLAGWAEVSRELIEEYFVCSHGRVLSASRVRCGIAWSRPATSLIAKSSK